MAKAFILTRKFAEVSRDPIDALEKAGFTVEEKDYDRVTSAQEEEICRAIQGADVLIITGMFPVTRRILESTDRLRMVAIRSAGFEGTDLAAATDRGRRRDP